MRQIPPLFFFFFCLGLSCSNLKKILLISAERRDEDTISTTSSNDVKRQDVEGGSISLDGEDSQTRDFSDIEDLLDDDLPISIPDATYVLKRDDFDDNGTAAVSQN